MSEELKASKWSILWKSLAGIATLMSVIIPLIGGIFWLVQLDARISDAEEADADRQADIAKLEKRGGGPFEQVVNVQLSEKVDGKRFAIWGSVKWVNGVPVVDPNAPGSGPETWRATKVRGESEGMVRIEILGEFAGMPIVMATAHNEAVVATVHADFVTTDGFLVKTNHKTDGLKSDGFSFFAISSDE